MPNLENLGSSWINSIDFEERMRYKMTIMATQQTPKVVRVTAEEFELDNGDIFPHAIELDEDEVPSVEEFQETYDHWRKVIANELKV